MLKEGDVEELRDQRRGFPYVLGFQLRPEPIALRPPGLRVDQAVYWSRDGQPKEVAMQGEVYHDGSVFKPGPT
eukprot:2961143-Pyramimonas_sp.AAC.1